MSKRTRRKNFIRIIISNILIVLVSCLQCYLLNLSCGVGEVPIERSVFLLNACFLVVFNQLLFLVCRNILISGFVSQLIVTVIAVANYYVIEYHGTPLTVAELGNIRTAEDVVGAYKFHLNRFPVLCGLLLAVFLVLMILELSGRRRMLRVRRGILHLGISLIMIGGAVGYIYTGLFGSQAIEMEMGWSWEEVYRQYGYVLSVVKDLESRKNVIQEPEVYSDEMVEEIEDWYVTDSASGNTPDVILILNETFYDLSLIEDLETDVDYLSHIHQMEDLQTGYAITPLSGGGTNDSEYELLTGNSLYLLASGTTPFNVLDLFGANSIVSVLNNRGYTTLGTHSEDSMNYNRGTAYRDLGFDIIHFNEDYTDPDYIGNRPYKTDQSIYDQMIQWYEEMGDGPRLVYQLTIQNHGGFELNDPEDDTVHLLNSRYSEADTERINEYLTSIAASDEAFANLIDYFRTVDREVIVIMVGDHSPDFASWIASGDLDEQEKNLRLRETPFLVWTNGDYFDDVGSDLGEVAMPFVVAKALERCGMNLSGYYEMESDLCTPIATSLATGEYLVDDTWYTYGEDGIYDEILSYYYMMEYHNLLGTDDEFYQ